MGRAALFLSCLLLAGAGTAAAEDAVRLGGSIEISEPVQGSLHAAGGQVTVDAAVSGDAFLAGGSVTVNGPVEGDLRIGGGHVTINSAVDGDASVGAGTLDLGPDARIAGKLSFHGGELHRDPAAQVLGALEQESGRWSHRAAFPTHRFLHGWVWTTGLIVLAAIIAGALPGPSRRMASELRERPWLTGLVGLIAITVIPVAAVLAMITVIGIPIGLLALVAYAALLMVGYVWLAVAVGGLLLDRVKPETAALTAWRVGAAALAMLALAVLARLPFVGGFIGFVALVVGVGMIVAVVMRRGAQPPAAPTMTAA